MAQTSKDSIKRVSLYGLSLAYLGTDASPDDAAPDEVGCADTVSTIVRNCFGDIIPHTVSTQQLFQILDKSSKFKRVKDFKFGDIIISPTAPGKQPGKLTNGHVGIVGEGDEIMSNDSKTGTFIQNYTIESWVKRYRDIGKYGVYSFRIV